MTRMCCVFLKKTNFIYQCKYWVSKITQKDQVTIWHCPSLHETVGTRKVHIYEHDLIQTLLWSIQQEIFECCIISFNFFIETKVSSSSAIY